MPTFSKSDLCHVITSISHAHNFYNSFSFSIFNFKILSYKMLGHGPKQENLENKENFDPEFDHFSPFSPITNENDFFDNRYDQSFFHPIKSEYNPEVHPNFNPHPAFVKTTTQFPIPYHAMQTQFPMPYIQMTTAMFHPQHYHHNHPPQLSLPKKRKMAIEAKNDSGCISPISTSSPKPLKKVKTENTTQPLTKTQLADFAFAVKQNRIKLGFTQADVGTSLGALFGKHFSQTTICRFESQQLSAKNLNGLTPVLKKWVDLAISRPEFVIQETQKCAAEQNNRKKRALDPESIGMLESQFVRLNGCLTNAHITAMANALDVEKEVVKSWYSKRKNGF